MLVEEALRDLATTHPYLPLIAAVHLVDRPDVPIPPAVHHYPPEETQIALAGWAAKVPFIVEFAKNHKSINAIKEIRHFTGCSLWDAKKAGEILKDMPQVTLP